MILHDNFNLHHLNAFGLDVTTRKFLKLENVQEIQKYLHTELSKITPRLVIGEGSNLLFIKDYPGLVIGLDFKGIKIIRKNKQQITVDVGASQRWDSFVTWSVKHGFWGAENLSCIPGSTGASPVQNIGAYGAEAEDIIESVQYTDLRNGRNTVLTASECLFGYRDSIFKNALKGKAIITSVRFVLSRIPRPNLKYQDLRQELEGSTPGSPEQVRDAVIRLRRKKLPDPGTLGNAGSFFKNPVIDKNDFTDLQKASPELPFHKINDREYKIPAAWLIEKSGWKGRRFGQTGTYPRQPLVIVNYGSATGADILELSNRIKNSVREQFGILLEKEVHVVGNH